MPPPEIDLLAINRGSVTAPAGCGKTHLIAEALMRKGFASLALIIQEVLKRDPQGGYLFVFRGRRGDLIKVIWHDGQGACLYTKRLDNGRFLWPSPGDG